MRTFLPLLAFVVVFSSCNNADPRLMASDVCQCLEPALKKLNPRARGIVSKSFRTGNVQEVIQAELQTIENDEERTKVAGEIQASGQLLQSRKVRACLKAIDAKYRVQKRDESAKQKEMIAEMEKVCETGALIVKYGIEHKDTASTENTDVEAARR